MFASCLSKASHSSHQISFTARSVNSKGFIRCGCAPQISLIKNRIWQQVEAMAIAYLKSCLLYTSPSPRDGLLSRMPSSAWKKNNQYVLFCQHLSLFTDYAAHEKCREITEVTSSERCSLQVTAEDRWWFVVVVLFLWTLFNRIFRKFNELIMVEKLPNDHTN